jgi:5-formyltetrahydrofolate cyclo-ligase
MICGPDRVAAGPAAPSERAPMTTLPSASDAAIVSQRKAQLRRQAAACRDGLDIDDRLIWDEAVVAAALSLPELQACGDKAIVAAYWPMKSEVDPRAILEGLAQTGIATALPFIAEDGVRFRLWTPWEPVEPVGSGTLGPGPSAPEVEPTILLIPLLAFDASGQRLGYGKGHYDRVLASLPDALPVGLAYDAQEVGALPCEPHDRPLAIIVTQSRIIRAG